MVDLAKAAPQYAALGEAVAGVPADQWVVVDLSALRPWIHQAANRQGREQVAEVIWRYDAVLLAPEFTPAEKVRR